MTSARSGDNLLVCAATAFELEAFPAGAGTRLVSGVGIPATLLSLLPRLEREDKPTLILNLGIAGAYPDTGIVIGDIVLADGETYGDVGFELPEPHGFRAIADSPFGADYDEPLPTIRPPEWNLIPPPEAATYRVHAARGCTVNACSGTAATGQLRRDRFGAGFETMEGAAVASAARAYGVPFCQIRAISNIAAERDMRPENIRLALQNLRHYLEACARRK